MFVCFFFSGGLPLPSRDSYFKASGPKDPIIKGSRAILMLRVKLGFRVEDFRLKGCRVLRLRSLDLRLGV